MVIVLLAVFERNAFVVPSGSSQKTVALGIALEYDIRVGYV
jgi:hypothetical protein